MGFDVFGPTRHIKASNIDDGDPPAYDILSLPRSLGLICPMIERLNDRFYASTVVPAAGGELQALRDELIRLRDVYRARLEPDLVRDRGVRTRNPAVRLAVIERLLHEDVTYRIIDDFRLLCDEALAAGADVRCEGD